MTDQIEHLTADAEIKLRAAIQTVLDRAHASFDVLTFRAILENLADDDPQHTIEQLELVMGLADGALEPLEAALDSSAAGGPLLLLLGFFTAVSSLAAASVGHALNTGQQRFTDPRNVEASGPLRRFIADSAKAIGEAIGRSIAAPGSEQSRALQLRRSIGLTAPQSRALDRMRKVMFDQLTAPGSQRGPKVAPTIDQALAAQRGLLSAPQIALLRKAFASNLSEGTAEALLDRHASAMRAHRVKVTAGHAAHAVSEAAKLTGWRIAQFFGFLPNTARRHWHTAGDERVRQSHAAVPGMNTGGVALNQPFNTPLGAVFSPPLEINCRCRAQLGAGQ